MSEVPYPPPTSHHPLTAEGSPYPALPTITTNYRAPVNGARNERGVLTSRAERRRDEVRVRKNDERDRRARVTSRITTIITPFSTYWHCVSPPKPCIAVTPT